MHFTSTVTSTDVVERNFTLAETTGILWSRACGSDAASLILLGHGGGLHKKAPGLVSRAHHYVTTCGFNVVGTDAPIGYGGMTLASAIGLPLTAIEPGSVPRSSAGFSCTRR